MLKAYITPLLLVIAMHCCAANEVDLEVSFDQSASAVILNFQLFKSGIKQYAIERKAENADWKELSAEELQTYNNGQPFSYNDQQPAYGKNYYRLKVIANSDSVEYSSTVQTYVPRVQNNWLIYPVPVRGSILTLEYKGIEKNKGVINITITSLSSGRTLTNMRFCSAWKTIQIPVDNLGKGIYDLTVVIENKIVWQQRFVK